MVETEGFGLGRSGVENAVAVDDAGHFGFAEFFAGDNHERRPKAFWAAWSFSLATELA